MEVSVSFGGEYPRQRGRLKVSVKDSFLCELRSINSGANEAHAADFQLAEKLAAV